MKRLPLVLYAVFCAAVVFAQSDLQVLAVVKLNKSESITVKQLKTRVEAYQMQRHISLSLDDRKKVLESMIQERLVAQAAQKAGITIPDSAVDQNFLQQISICEKSFFRAFVTQLKSTYNNATFVERQTRQINSEAEFLPNCLS